MMPLSGKKIAVVALLFGVGALVSCTKGLQAPKPSPEVYILDGLVFEYGAETPCYRDGVEEHGKRCDVWGKDLKQRYPVVQVALEPFAIDRQEVSNIQYRHCVETSTCDAPWYTDSFDQGIDYYYNDRYDEYPVHQVTWVMAQAYCELLGRRLPTDAEWQRVAQGSRALGTHRTYPAEGGDASQADDAAREILTLDDCQAQDANINAIVCNGVKEFAPVDEPGGDFVREGYDANLEPAQVFHLFSNVSEFTADDFQEDVTCQEPLPTGFICIPSVNGCTDYDGGDFAEHDNCIACAECSSLSADPADAPDDGLVLSPKDRCLQECRKCEACEGTMQDGFPYFTDGYPVGPYDCMIDCYGRTRENPSCVRWTPEDQPLEPAAVVGAGTEKSVRGGHVGIPIGATDECRFRADYRDKRYQPDGSPDTSNLATAKGVGFRCARTLVQGELDALAQDGRFAHLAAGPPEALEVVHPSFSVEIDPPPTPEPDVTESPATPDVIDPPAEPDASGSDDTGPEPDGDPS